MPPDGEQAGRPRRDDVPQRLNGVQRHFPDEHQVVLARPLQVADEGAVVGTLEQLDETTALEPDEDSDPADAVCETPTGLGREFRAGERVGVHDQDGVLVAELWEEEGEGLVQGPRPSRLATNHDGVCACRLSREGITVRVDVGADDREVRARALLVERANRLSDVIVLGKSGDHGDCQSAV